MYRSGVTNDERYTYHIGNLLMIIYYLYIIIIGACILNNYYINTDIHVLVFIVHGILSKMARREFFIFIIFSDTYTCSYVV